MSYDIITGSEEVSELPDTTWDGGGAYDDTETVIGTRNGKPLYRKIVNFKTVSGASAWKNALDITDLNIDELVEITAFGMWPNSPYYNIPLNFGTNWYVAVSTVGNKKYIQTYISANTWANYQAKAVLIYTKTTD